MSESTRIKNLSDGEFTGSVERAGGVSLIDFWAEWCGPCRTLGPTIDRLADEFEGRVNVYKMNVDENPGTPTRFQIRSIPTLLVFKDGQLVDQIVGAVPKEVIARTLENHVERKSL